MSTHFHVSGTGVTGPLAGLRSHYKWWVLVTAIFGAFVSLLDATVVNTALPHIQLAFGTDLHTCTGYLDHPFKNKPFETEKQILSLLANTGGSV